MMLQIVLIALFTESKMCYRRLELEFEFEYFFKLLVLFLKLFIFVREINDLMLVTEEGT